LLTPSFLAMVIRLSQTAGLDLPFASPPPSPVWLSSNRAKYFRLSYARVSPCSNACSSSRVLFKCTATVRHRVAAQPSTSGAWRSTRPCVPRSRPTQTLAPRLQVDGLTTTGRTTRTTAAGRTARRLQRTTSVDLSLFLSLALCSPLCMHCDTHCAHRFARTVTRTYASHSAQHRAISLRAQIGLRFFHIFFFVLITLNINGITCLHLAI
jgi:hypothetical protein